MTPSRSLSALAGAVAIRLPEWVSEEEADDCNGCMSRIEAQTAVQYLSAIAVQLAEYEGKPEWAEWVETCARRWRFHASISGLQYSLLINGEAPIYGGQLCSQHSN